MGDIISLNAYRNRDYDFTLGKKYMYVILMTAMEERGIVILDKNSFIEDCFGEITNAERYELPVTAFFSVCEEYNLSDSDSLILFNSLANTVFRFYKMNGHHKHFLYPTIEPDFREKNVDLAKVVILVAAALTFLIAIVFAAIAIMT